MKNINWKAILSFAVPITFFIILISTAIILVCNADDVQARKTCITTAVSGGVEKQKAIDYCVAYQNWMKEMDSKGWK